MLEAGFYNMDCMEGMKQFPDEFFDLAIVDPPYGINVASHKNGQVVGGGIGRLGDRLRASRKRGGQAAIRNPITPSRMTVLPTKVISESWRG